MFIRPHINEEGKQQSQHEMGARVERTLHQSVNHSRESHANATHRRSVGHI